MNKLELAAQVLNTDLKNPELTDDKRKEIIANEMREFSADLMNITQYLLSKNMDWETQRDIVEGYGIGYDGKTKKFK